PTQKRVTRSGPRTASIPRASVVLPAALSPARPNRTGLVEPVARVLRSPSRPMLAIDRSYGGRLRAPTPARGEAGVSPPSPEGLSQTKNGTSGPESDDGCRNVVEEQPNGAGHFPVLSSHHVPAPPEGKPGHRKDLDGAGLE